MARKRVNVDEPTEVKVPETPSVVNRPKIDVKKQVYAEKEKVLKAKIEELSFIKPQKDILSKQVDKVTVDIKSLLNDLDIKEYSIDNGFVVNITNVVSNTFDEERLIEWALKNKKPIIKTITVIDEEALENLVYNHKILPEELQPFQITKVSQRMYAKFIK